MALKPQFPVFLGRRDPGKSRKIQENPPGSGTGEAETALQWEGEQRLISLLINFSLIGSLYLENGLDEGFGMGLEWVWDK